MKKLLLVEDDSSLGATLTERLQKENYMVYWSQSLTQAREQLKVVMVDLIILDVGLPDGTGFDLAREVKKKTKTPFIFVTAQTDAEARLQGYELGAEEYIPKPFHLKELLMRVEHVLHNHSHDMVFEVQGLKINFETLSIGSEVLPVKDMQVLEFLIEKSPKIVSRDDILNHVWGDDKYPSNRTVDNTILRLRQALGADVGQKIKSIRSVGYQWL